VDTFLEKAHPHKSLVLNLYYFSLKMDAADHLSNLQEQRELPRKQVIPFWDQNGSCFRQESILNRPL